MQLLPADQYVDVFTPGIVTLTRRAEVALSFRLDPSFLPEVEYPKKPFGMFFVVGADFRGFHVRFRDVARGGIRIIRSRGKENYNTNVRTLFDENYALAATQNLSTSLISRLSLEATH